MAPPGLPAQPLDLHKLIGAVHQRGQGPRGPHAQALSGDAICLSDGATGHPERLREADRFGPDGDRSKMSRADPPGA